MIPSHPSATTPERIHMPAKDPTQDLPGLLKQLHEAHQEFWGGPPCSDIWLIEEALATELARITDLNRVVQAQRDYAYILFLGGAKRPKEGGSKQVSKSRGPRSR